MKIEHDRKLYRQRSCIERMFGHLKIYRAIATHYDQLTNRFLGAAGSLRASLAPGYTFGIVDNYPLVDGNKRTG